MLILLPPSEGKAERGTGAPLDLGGLGFPELTETRARILEALVRLCQADPVKALDVLGLTERQVGEVARNAGLPTAMTLPAARVYTGVLYDALGLASLDGAARRRAGRALVVVSALWGALRPADRIPPYRLAMGVNLPGAGPLARAWRAPLGATLPGAAGRGLVIDLRSAAYAAAWTPTGPLADRWVTVRVVRERAGTRTVVSHMAKQARGLLARHLLSTDTPRRLGDLLDVARQRWAADLQAPVAPGRPSTLELVAG